MKLPVDVAVVVVEGEEDDMMDVGIVETRDRPERIVA
jgi:hypothetical protein